MQKATVAYSIYTFDNFPWTEMNDETTAPPNHLNLSLSKHSTEPTTHQALAPSSPMWVDPKLMFVMDAFVFSASAKAWRQRQIKAGILFVGSTVKTWSLKSWEQICKSEKNTFNPDMWISLMRNLENNGNQSRNSHFLYHLHARRSLLDQLWMTKLQHPQTIQTCHCQTMSGTRHHTSKIIKSWLSAAISESHHTPGLGALDTNLVTIQIDVRNGRVYLQCLGQGLKPATDRGWHLDLRSLQTKPDNLNSKKKWRLTDS